MAAGEPDARCVREARREDHAEFARLFLELGVREPPPSLERWTPAFRARTFFLVPEGHAHGRAAGYAHYLVAGDAMYVSTVVVDPAWRGRGLGRALMRELARRARANGCTQWRLNVRAGNEPALRLYRSVGLATVHTTQLLRLRWELLDGLDASGSTSVQVRAIADRDEATRIERTFDLFPTSLSGSLSEPRRHLFALFERDGGCAGVASFDPDFPGASPFRVRAVSQAPALLAAMSVHRRAEPAWVQLAVEADAALGAALIAAGGELHLELQHMRGAIPT